MPQVLDVLLWVVLPVLNFCIFLYVGQNSSWKCASVPTLVDSREAPISPSSTARIVEGEVSCLQENSYHFARNSSVFAPRKESTAPSADSPRCGPLLGETDNSGSPPSYLRPHVEFVDTEEFDKYRSERLGSYTYPETVYSPHSYTAVLHARKGDECLTLDHHFQAFARSEYCFAVVRITQPSATNHDSVAHDAPPRLRSPIAGALLAPVGGQPGSEHQNETAHHSYNIARYSTDINVYGVSISKPDKSQIDKYSVKYDLNEHNKGKQPPTGFFRKVPKVNGRERVKMKLGPFLTHYDAIQHQLARKLDSNGIRAGDDLTVMVVNEGEIDLYLNFACSCQKHGISLAKIIVFAGSSEILTMIEATGAMALYHEGYASVSKKPSYDYLDRVFVDMMWFKAFAIYLILQRRINILFQDIDFVWFKDPMYYFHKKMNEARGKAMQTGAYLEAFFSDDGQRSHRYTPFYANSGFYFLLATERSEYFAWSIMTAFDAVQVLGSHQNVFTMKLNEGLGIGAEHSMLLPMRLFPNGLQYHHDKRFMRAMLDRKIRPYGFHMCWTQGKPDKLKYLRLSKMWYLSDVCSPLTNLISPKSREEERQKEEMRERRKRLKRLSKQGRGNAPSETKNSGFDKVKAVWGKVFSRRRLHGSNYTARSSDRFTSLGQKSDLYACESDRCILTTYNESTSRLPTTLLLHHDKDGNRIALEKRLPMGTSRRHRVLQQQQKHQQQQQEKEGIFVDIYSKYVSANMHLSKEIQWEKLAGACCQNMPGSP